MWSRFCMFRLETPRSEKGRLRRNSTPYTHFSYRIKSNSRTTSLLPILSRLSAARAIAEKIGATGCFSVLLMTYFLTKRNIGFGDVGFGLSVGWFLGDWLWIPALFLASLLGIGFILSKRQCIQCKRIPFVPFVAFSSLCVEFFSNTG